jgi:hypothetical protein
VTEGKEEVQEAENRHILRRPYERTVPDSHFLQQMERLFDWEVFADKLVHPYRGKAQAGRPRYNPLVLSKLLLLSHLYGLSELRTEVCVSDHSSAKYFLGLTIDEPAPKHSTLMAFKRRIVRRGGDTEYFHGYKMHNSINAGADKITRIVVMGAEGHDGKQFPEEVRKDRQLGLRVEICPEDRGYDDGDNHYLLESLGLKSAIHLNRYRTEKKNGNREI